ncbi:MAG: TetR family transcriptional regulator [Nakamurella sp.]
MDIDQRLEPTPRTPRVEVRERTLDAAERGFFERGYRAASLTEISRSAGFTKGAVYSNFESKLALLAELLAAHSAPLGRTALAQLADQTDLSVDLAYRAGQLLAAEVDANREWNILLVELAVHATADAEAARSYAEFRAQQRRGLADALTEYIPGLGPSADTDVDGAAFVLVTMISALALESAADPGHVYLDAIAALFTTVVAALIGEKS